jgi:hypothetical protein
MTDSLLRGSPRKPSLHALLCAAVALALLAGCDAGPAIPGKDAVAQAVGQGCTVVSVEDMERLPENKPGYRRVTYPYWADCVPNGGATARRVHGQMVFEEYAAGEMLGGGKFWSGGRKLLDDAPAAKTGEKGTVTLVATDCTTYVKRVVSEVLPCLQHQKPDLVAPLQAQVDAHSRRAQVEVVTPNQAAAEIEYDTQCLERWRQINRQLPTGQAPGACGLPD